MSHASRPSPLRRDEESLSLQGVTFLVTGGNTGIGRATAVALARQGGDVWIACRSPAKAADVANAIPRGSGTIRAMTLDLGDLRSVRACALDFLANGGRLDVLVNNAGIGWTRGGETAQGFERHFGVNHLGHFLLTKLLLDALRKAPAARIVNVSSMAHYHARRIDWDALRRPTRPPIGRPEYCVSKLCNVLHAKELARELTGTNVRTYSLHPGVVASDIWRSIPRLARWLVTRKMMSVDDGARTTLHCATSADVADETGLYYDGCRPKTPSALSEDRSLARELFARSCDWVAPYAR